MMGGETPETCWAVNKNQDNKLENCYIRLVIYLNCMMIHGLTDLKFFLFLPFSPFSLTFYQFLVRLPLLLIFLLF
jgi:hypothetical protein